jgi:small GTP-binding protein
MTDAANAPLLKKVCMLGSYAVGKTSLVRRYFESVFDERYLTTVGVKIDRKRVKAGDQEIDLVIWDLAGDDEIVKPRPSNYRGTSGYILVVDGCRPNTAERAIALQQSAFEISGPVPVVVAINKADLKASWEIGPAEREKLAQTGSHCFETSAKTGDAVDRLFLALAENMLSEMNDQPGD